MIDNRQLSTETAGSPATTGWDKMGVFILPEKYFGVERGTDIGFDSGFPMKLYVNRKSNPATIEVRDTGANRIYEFVRIADPTRVR